MTPALALACLIALALAVLVYVVIVAIRHDRADRARFGRPFPPEKDNGGGK